MSGKVGTAEKVGIDYPPDHDALRCFGSYRVLEAYAHHADEDVFEDTRKRVSIAMRRFPEFGGEAITIAAREPWDHKLGRADMRNRIVYLPTEHASSWITVYHELAHLAIQIRDERGDDVAPSSERYTGLFGVARMPTEHVDEQRIPYFECSYCRTPEYLPVVARHALAYRQAHHDYHQQAIRWLEAEDDLPDEDPEFPEAIR